MTTTDYPGFGYQIEMGATTIWERWEYLTGTSMNSHNHPMFGSVDAWFYRCLAGINPDSEDAAFGHINIAPVIPDELDFVEASLETTRGILKSSWKKTERGIEYNLTIPPNSKATLTIKTSGDKYYITESGYALNSDSPGIIGIGRGNGCVSVKMGSGEYKFTAESGD